MKIHRALRVVSCVLLALLARAQPSSGADAAVEARQRYERAVELYAEGAFDAALVELERSAALRPSYRLFYNIGQVHLARHDYAAAREAYRQYLKQGGERVPRERRAAVQSEMERLASRVAVLHLVVDVRGAEVLIDGVMIGTTPLPGAVVLNAGLRRVVVQHPGYPPLIRQISLPGAMEDTLELRFVPRRAAESRGGELGRSPPRTPSGAGAAGSARQTDAAQPTPAQPTATPLDSVTSSRKPAMQWLGWGLTGALAAGAAVTGVLALSEGASLADRREQLGASHADLDASATRVRTLALVTDGLAVLALAAGGVTWWLGSNARGRVAPSPTAIGAGPSGIWVRSSF